MKKRQRQSIGILLAAIVAGIGARSATKAADFAIRQSRDVNEKLAPELLAALSTGATFIGLTKHSPTTSLGLAVLQTRTGINLVKDSDLLDGRPGINRVMGHVSDSHIHRINELLVGYKSDKKPREGRIAGLEVIRTPDAPYMVLRSNSGFPAARIAELANDPDIRYIEPNYPYELLSSAGPLVPDDTDFPKLWGMRNIHAPEAWGAIHASPKVVVAVLDTGIDYHHDDLKTNIWTNPGEVGKDAKGRDKSTNHEDDDRNGYVDDVHGYDFIDNDGDPYPGKKGSSYYHGTHCAGIIGAIGMNKLGVAGVTWKVQIMILRVFDQNGGQADADVIALAIDYAVRNGARILSNSWGGPNYSKSAKEAIDRARAQGVLVVACAANEGTCNDGPVPYYPASYPCDNILAVMAIDPSEQVPSFSNFGKTRVHLAAPGVEIFSTVPDNDYDELSGTSAAVPHVSGAAALILAAHPKYQYNDIKDLIIKHVRKLPSLVDKCSSQGTLDIRFLGGEAKALGDGR